MSEFTDRLLRDMQRTYDYFAGTPGASVQMLAKAVGVKEATAFTWCKKATKRGELSRVKGKPCVHTGNISDSYSAVPGKRPEVLLPPTPRAPYKISADREAPKHITAPAKQVGAKRDPLVAALFGMAGA